MLCGAVGRACTDVLALLLCSSCLDKTDTSLLNCGKCTVAGICNLKGLTALQTKFHLQLLWGCQRHEALHDSRRNVSSGEGTVNAEEHVPAFTAPSSFILRPSSCTLHPSSFIPHPSTWLHLLELLLPQAKEPNKKVMVDIGSKP